MGKNLNFFAGIIFSWGANLEFAKYFLSSITSRAIFIEIALNDFQQLSICCSMYSKALFFEMHGETKSSRMFLQLFLSSMEHGSFVQNEQAAEELMEQGKKNIQKSFFIVCDEFRNGSDFNHIQGLWLLKRLNFF